MQPSNEAELCNAVATAVSITDRPSCFRFPRGNGIGVELADFGVTSNLKGRAWPLGKGVVRRQGKDVALVGYGTSVNDCLAAAEMLSERGISATVTDMRYAIISTPFLFHFTPGHVERGLKPWILRKRHLWLSASNAVSACLSLSFSGRKS